MADTNIGWTHKVWNLLVGCSLESPGCTNCYAMAMAHRIQMMSGPESHYFGTTKVVNGKPVWTGKICLAPEHIVTAPLRWKKPSMIFVNSMSDLFHPDVPFGVVMRAWDVMGRAGHHTYQILTKRPDRMRQFLRLWSDVNPKEDWDFKRAQGPKAVRAAHKSGRGQLFADMLEAMGTPPSGCAFPYFDWAGGMSRWPAVLPNVWLGVSCEDQKRADERVPLLLDAPAAVRWVSAEPLLEEINFRALNPGGVQTLDALSGVSRSPDYSSWPTLGWIVAGLESGPNRRVIDIAAAESIQEQCEETGVAFFFKQDAHLRPGQRGRASDRLWACKQYPTRLAA